jgi:hypothetical protein
LSPCRLAGDPVCLMFNTPPLRREIVIPLAWPARVPTLLTFIRLSLFGRSDASEKEKTSRIGIEI